MGRVLCTQALWVTEQSGPIPHPRIQFPLPNSVKEAIQNDMQLDLQTSKNPLASKFDLSFTAQVPI